MNNQVCYINLSKILDISCNFCHNCFRNSCTLRRATDRPRTQSSLVIRSVTRSHKAPVPKHERYGFDMAKEVWTSWSDPTTATFRNILLNLMQCTSYAEVQRNLNLMHRNPAQKYNTSYRLRRQPPTLY